MTRRFVTLSVPPPYWYYCKCVSIPSSGLSATHVNSWRSVEKRGRKNKRTNFQLCSCPHQGFLHNVHAFSTRTPHRQRLHLEMKEDRSSGADGKGAVLSASARFRAQPIDVCRNKRKWRQEGEEGEDEEEREMKNRERGGNCASFDHCRLLLGNVRWFAKWLSADIICSTCYSEFWSSSL